MKQDQRKMKSTVFVLPFGVLLVVLHLEICKFSSFESH